MWKTILDLFFLLMPQSLYRTMKKFVLDLLFPINCLGCGQEGQFICPACFEQIPLNRERPLKFSSSALTDLIITSDYNHALVKQTIHRYKYDFVKELAEPLGLLMAKQLTPYQSKFGTGQAINSLLIPVPLHQKRLRWRGFNQAELLAEVISRKLRIPLADNILIRRKHRLPQMAIKSSQERKENIKQAFQLNPETTTRTVLEIPRSCEARTWSKGLSLLDTVLNLRHKTLVLIDDVCTTGATLEECAQVLKPLQPKQIWGLVIARG